MEPQKNLNAVFLGIGEFSFSPGAKTRAAAKAAGFEDFGNINAFSLETDNTKDEHEGSYRTGKRTDKIFFTKQKLEYLIKTDEITARKLRILLMADDSASDNAAEALVGAVSDALAFSADAASRSDRWYDVLIAGARRRGMTGLELTTGPAIEGVAESTDEKITAAGHGLLDGDRVIITDGAPTGLSAGVVYFVRDKTTDTFEVAETADGAALDITADGTPTLYKLLEADDYEADLRLGRVRILTEQTADIFAIVSAPEIQEGDTGYMKRVDPLSNPTQEGYGRMVLFDPEDRENIKWDHQDFSCIITTEKLGELDGKKASEASFRVTLTADEGDFDYDASDKGLEPAQPAE